MFARTLQILQNLRTAQQRLGFGAGLGFMFKDPLLRRLPRRGAPATYWLHAPEAAYPLLARAGSSDRYIFRNIFISEEYGFVPEPDGPVVVDCGANTGYASAYFASKWPDARIIAVEPEAGNFAILTANAAPYGGRVSPLQTGIWPRSAGLKVVKGQYADGRDWSTQVREAAPGESPDLTALSIPDLMARYDLARIDLLKIDIERAELELFEDGAADEWLPRVAAIVIELHDQACRDAFFGALARSGEGYAISEHGELTMARWSLPKR